MTDTDELPVFPASAPDLFSNSEATIELMEGVLDALALVVDVPKALIDNATPCRDFTVGDLQRHALAWLQFFADALNDPDGEATRIDTETWKLTDEDPSSIVRTASERIVSAVRAGVTDRLVVMSQARMNGDAVVAMALGEYIVHGWDLATATATATARANANGTPWTVSDEAATQARLFLEGTVAPEYRGEDSGFFGDEVTVPADASALDRLLGFAGRDPGWVRA